MNHPHRYSMHTYLCNNIIIMIFLVSSTALALPTAPKLFTQTQQLQKARVSCLFVCPSVCLYVCMCMCVWGTYVCHSVLLCALLLLLQLPLIHTCTHTICANCCEYSHSITQFLASIPVFLIVLTTIIALLHQPHTCGREC